MHQSHKRYLRYLGAGVAGSLLCYPAYGGDLVVSSTQNTAAATSAGDGNGPGNVTVTSAGSISVTSGAAVTLDSSHTVVNAGTIQNSGESNAVGILVSTTQNITGALTSDGSINIPGPASASALFPAFVNNVGIAVRGTGTYQGAITLGSASTITVGGNGAKGLDIAGRVAGTVTANGAITLARQNAFGISTTAQITGDLVNGGTITLTGQESVGIYAGGTVGGAIINRGTIVSGKAATTDAQANTTAAVRGAPSIWVASSVNGILLEGNGLTTAQEADGIPAGSPADSSLKTYGGADALSITQGGAAGNATFTVGRITGDASGASLLVRGNVSSEATNIAVRAVNISGTTVNGIDYRTTLDGSFTNMGGNISAIGTNAAATAVRIGNLATVPTLVNSGDILARGIDSGEDATTGSPGGGGGNAFGVIVEATGNLASVVNSGVISGESHGATQSGYGIIDYSGTLRTITNSGTLTATARGNGAAVAFDLSKSTGIVQFSNTGTVTGDMRVGDSGSNFVSTGGTITGEFVGGAGNDSVSLNGGTIFGAINLGAGANAVTVVNTTMTGGVTLGDGGTNTLNISGSTVELSTLTGLNATHATIGTSTLTFNVNTATETSGPLKADTVVINPGTTIKAVVTGSVINTYTANLIEAQSLTLSPDTVIQQPVSSIMYQRSIQLADTNPNILQYQIARRSAQALGLTGDLAAIYESSITSLGLDDVLGPVLANLQDRSVFESAFTQMIPDVSSATRVAALESQRQSQVAIRRRMTGFGSDQSDPLGDYYPTFWIQQYDTFGSDKGSAAAPGFRLSSYGIAGGLDADLTEGSLVGLSISHSRNSAEAKHSLNKPTHVAMTTIDVYGRNNFSFGYVQGILGVGYDKYSSERTLKVDTTDRTAQGSWAGNHWGGSVEAGSSYAFENLTLTGYGRASYFDVYEHAYTETEGGGINLRYYSRENTSVRAAVGGIAETGFDLGSFAVLKFAARGEFAHEFDTSATRVKAFFAAGGDPFTMTGAAPSTSVVNAGGTLGLQFRRSLLSLDYGLERAGTYTGHSVALTYRMRL